jgi:hypothetical protein
MLLVRLRIRCRNSAFSVGYPYMDGFSRSIENVRKILTGFRTLGQHRLAMHKQCPTCNMLYVRNCHGVDIHVAKPSATAHLTSLELHICLWT